MGELKEHLEEQVKEAQENANEIENNVEDLKQFIPAWLIRIIVSLFVLLKGMFSVSLMIFPVILLFGKTSFWPCIFCGLIFAGWLTYKRIFNSGINKIK